MAIGIDPERELVHQSHPHIVLIVMIILIILILSHHLTTLIYPICQSSSSVLIILICQHCLHLLAMSSLVLIVLICQYFPHRPFCHSHQHWVTVTPQIILISLSRWRKR